MTRTKTSIEDVLLGIDVPPDFVHDAALAHAYFKAVTSTDGIAYDHMKAIRETVSEIMKDYGYE